MINALAAHDTNTVQQLLTSGYDVNMNLGDDMGECVMFLLPTDHEAGS